MLATRGCLPFRRVEGNTQSPAWEYVVFCFQRRMKSASNGWSGTGPFDALLFGKPTWPHVQVRRTWIIPSAKLTSCHCKPKHSDMRSPVPAAKSVRVRSGSRRLHTIAYACSGMRIIASYPLVVLQRTKRMGFDSWFRGIRPYLWPCLYTKDMTRRVLSSVGLARCPSFFKALSHCSTSNGSIQSAILLPHRGTRRFRRTHSYPFMVVYSLGRIDSEHSTT